MTRSIRSHQPEWGDTNERSRMLTISRPLLLALGAMLILASCGDSTKRALGLQRTPPDEFAVVRRAPLSQPPDFKLRPPKPGAPRPGVASPREQAREAIFRGEQADGATARNRANEGPRTSAAPQGEVRQITPGESALLARAGADEVAPDIRTTVDRENALLRDADLNFVQRLLDFEPNIDDVVDAPAEARRLRENQALGRPATDGNTPTIERKTDSLFRIF